MRSAACWYGCISDIESAEALATDCLSSRRAVIFRMREGRSAQRASRMRRASQLYGEGLLAAHKHLPQPLRRGRPQRHVESH